MMRIKNWQFAIRQFRELIPRSVVGIHSSPQDPIMGDISKNITRQGITNSTLHYLRVSTRVYFTIKFSGPHL